MTLNIALSRTLESNTMPLFNTREIALSETLELDSVDTDQEDSLKTVQEDAAVIRRRLVEMARQQQRARSARTANAVEALLHGDVIDGPDARLHRAITPSMLVPAAQPPAQRAQAPSWFAVVSIIGSGALAGAVAGMLAFLI